MRFLLACIALLGVTLAATLTRAADTAYPAKVAPATQDYEKAMKAVRLPKGLTIDLWAAEPLLANPVIFALDHRNRVYVAETFRLHQGVTDIRGYLDPKGKFWLDEDLACRTVEDRIAMTRRKLGSKAADWEKHHERIRLVEDTTGKGKADRSTVFAEGFSKLEDGLGAGLLARGDTVWYACIPHLWQLRDPKGTGTASERKSLSSGYGVRYGFIGHDLHGLIMGPDGKIYFSIGDRGLNVPLPGGKRLEYPDTGAVLRCNPDGSDLEVYASGLRNPQELAFDNHGNLFTGDNNSDGGDRARWVYLLEGGDSGWRIGYQFDGAQGTRGPWNAEKLWHPPHAEQPAWIVPPITNLGDGPSGLVYYPGIGLPERYNDHFFMADFRGGPGNSGIRSFANKAKGAGFELTDSHEFIWSVLATDVDFMTDGSLMLSDWVNGWGLTGKGRLWRIHDAKYTNAAIAQETKKLLAEGFTKRPEAELAKLLGHTDRRVRQEAHFELAARGDKGVPVLTKAATEGKGLERYHAIWGLGIAARNKVKDALVAVPKLLDDADLEVRVQALRVLGDNRVTEARPAIVAALKDESPRVQSIAAQALGKIPDASSIAPLTALLRKNADADPWLRHTAIVALAACADVKALRELATDAAPAVRRAVVVAMRRTQNADIVRLLSDADDSIVTEAARAINDAPIETATEALARLLGRTGLNEATQVRSLNANYRLGKPEHAEAVARFAARSDAPLKMRLEALKMLESWAEPNGRDRIVGVWRPVGKREATIAPAALRSQLAGIFSGPDALRKEAARVAAKLGIKEVGVSLLALLQDAKAAEATRAEALLALESLKDSRLEDAVGYALKTEGLIRAAGRDVLSRRNPEQALPELRKALESDRLVEMQRAFDTLGAMKAEGARTLLAESLERLKSDKIPSEARLELVEAAAKVPALKSKLPNLEKDRFRYSLEGGDALRGRDLFINKSAVSCLRCHKAEGLGVGEVGPDLTGIGAKQKREYLLEAITEPNKVIAKGYETAELILKNGTTRSGIVRSENDTEIVLLTPEGTQTTVRKDRIERRSVGRSAMPEDLHKYLSAREMRDLIAFLASLTKQPSGEPKK
jgi:quinoprotein glucose dehydrogenase